MMMKMPLKVKLPKDCMMVSVMMKMPPKIKFSKDSIIGPDATTTFGICERTLRSKMV